MLAISDFADAPHPEAGDELFRLWTELMEQVRGQSGEKLRKRDIVLHLIPFPVLVVQRPD